MDSVEKIISFDSIIESWFLLLASSWNTLEAANSFFGMLILHVNYIYNYI